VYGAVRCGAVRQRKTLTGSMQTSCNTKQGR
jgi:hypothetical protein